MEAIILEQFLRVLYPDVRTWVKEREPTTAAEAVRLAESYITAHKGAGSFSYAGSLPVARGKSEGSGGGSNSQARVLKLTQNKATTPCATYQSVDKEDVVCFHCGQPGHTRPLCPLKKPKPTSLCYVLCSVESSPMKCNSQPVRSVLLNVLRETWEEGPSESKNEIQHVLDLITKLHTLGQLSMENLLRAQDKQSRLYNRGTRLRNFAPGDKVLVLLPTSSSKLLAKWQGPFEVTQRVGDLNYEVSRTDRSGARQIYHLNLLKKWSEVELVMLATAISGEDDLGPEVNTKIQSLTLAPGGDHLSPSQLTDVARLQTEFADVFSPLPGRTNLIQHHIETEPGVVVRSRPYRLPEHKKKVVQSELEAMLEMGVIEESHSDWVSPIILIPKTDGSVRFCVDYRKVNAVSKFDAYPMPRVDELLDRLGTSRIYSTLDLTKRYWQIPLSPLSKEKTAFTTPFGLHQFVTLPFGFFWAPATFQRLMDKILRRASRPESGGGGMWRGGRSSAKSAAGERLRRQR